MRMTLSEAIVLLMEEPSYRSMTMDEISRIFGKTKLEREEVKKNIFELSKIGKIVIDSKRRCDLPERKGFLRGILSVNAKGYGFITREEGDVFIAPHNYVVDFGEYDYSAYENRDKFNNATSSTGVDINLAEAYSTYGIANKGKGVCISYAKTFTYLARKVGLESVVVTGYVNGNAEAGHAWNADSSFCK